METILDLSQAQKIEFVMLDTNNDEVTGLGTGITVQVSKNGGAFAGSAGTKAEISNGWYSYITTAGETDTVGPLAVKVTHATTRQQNLVYYVKAAASGAIEFTYTVIDGDTNAIEGVEVWTSTDISGSNVIWLGHTDASGIARDADDNKPMFDAGTYYFWSKKSGYTFTNPDTEVVS